MATSDNGTTAKQFSVAKAAYNAPDVATFTAELDANMATVKGKDGEPDKQVRRIASASANITDDAQFWTLMHHPIVATKGRYDDGDLSYMTRYAIGLALAEVDGSLKVPKDVRDSITSALDAEREAQRQAQADRMKGLGGVAAEEVKAAKAKAAQFDKVLAMLTDEQKAALGLS